MKRKFKGISLLVVILLVTTFISVKTSAVSISTQPNFTIQNLEAAPNPAKVNEDIVVKGQLVPEDFETKLQQKEIVLVLDTSGSMNEEVEVEINQKCTEQRVRYCITHNSSSSNHKKDKKEHEWKENYYCVSHNKFLEHNKVVKSTKIEELKKATKSFIETMKNVPNLKLGIVAYSTEATINPYEYNYGKRTIKSLDSDTYFEVQNYKSYNTSFLENNNDILGKIIDNIKPLGGTNTGEGLRKAIYMLDNGDENASKTIVLMSDGKPTYYSTYSNKSFYKEIDNTYPKIAGTGSSTNNQTREYSNLIAKMIKDKGYNSYSIGYGITDGKDDFMRVHASMRGLSSTEEANEANGFFEKSDGSITEIFNQIAENIKASYDLNEVSLEIEFNQGFRINIEGNEVNVGNITYNKVSESGGRIVYHAEPVNFSFIVKASEVGENQSIFNNLYVKFPWNNQKVKVNPKGELKIGIIPNDLPNISAKLLSNKIIETKKGNEINIKYEIKPEDFQYNNAANSGDMDVVVIFEKGFKEENTFINIRNALWNKLIKGLPENGKTKFSFILFNGDKEADKVISLKDYETASDYYGEIQKIFAKLENGKYTDSSSKGIYDPIDKALSELSKNSRVTASKNIVIIANNDINYNKQNNDYEELFKKVKELKYNIVTLSLGSENTNRDLYTVHTLLGGEKSSIFYANNDSNDINNSKMDLVKNKIISSAVAKPYEFKPVIKLNLGSNFTAIKGINDLGVVEFPAIIYNLTQNNNYHAESQILEFTLKVNNLTSGTYGFGVKSDNTMTYSSLLGKNVVVNLETPEIIIKDQVKDLVHGLYEGIENNKINIYTPLEGDKTTISPGATITFGTKFITSNDDFELTLNGDSKFNQIKPSDIKVYKIDKTTNSLVEVNRNFITITNLNDNRFTIKASNLNNKSEDTEIVIIYKGRIEEYRENESFINSVKISDLNAEVRIKTGSSSNSNTEENEGDYQEVLPDLF